MFLMKSMIFMHFTPSAMINYVAIIVGKDSLIKVFIREIFFENLWKMTKKIKFYLNKGWTSFKLISDKMSVLKCGHSVSSRLAQPKLMLNSKQSPVIFIWSLLPMFPQVNQMIVLALLKQLVLLQVRLNKTISESLSPIMGDPSETFVNRC